MRGILLVILFAVLPAAGLLALLELADARLLGSVWPDLADPARRYDAPPWRIGYTLLSIALALLAMVVVGHWLSPARARRKGRPEMPALLRDLLRYGILVVAVAVTLRWIWGEQVDPIIGALGIGGVVIGLALQETLSNFFAGLAVLAEKPFRPGDWIRIGDRVEGRVEHVTWRSTRIRTRDDDHQVFPNSLVTKEVIMNFLEPERRHAIRLQIGTSYRDPPDKVKRALLDIVSSVPGVLRSPRPVVYLTEYGDFAIQYEIKCFLEDYGERLEIEDRILHRVWYIFRRRGIEIPFPIRTLHLHRTPPTPPPLVEPGELRRALASVPIFATLLPEDLDALAEGVRLLEFTAGEPVIRQGDAGASLYVVLSGRVWVRVRTEAGTEETVAELGAGEVLGEMALLTGEPRTASVEAGESAILCEVTRGLLQPILARHPDAAERMAHVVASRREGLDRALEAAESPGLPPTPPRVEKGILESIRQLFRL